MSNFDFVAIGDVTTDAFIKLSVAEIHKDVKKDENELCMPWGAKLPYERVDVVAAVGNCANAAVSAVRLGLNGALLSHVGDDKFGDEQMETLKKEGVATDLMTVNPGRPSNYHYVLSFQSERTILVKHEEWDYKVPEMTTRWLYLTSLAENSLPYHHELMKYVEANPDVKLVFQPGTFQFKLGRHELADVYSKAHLFFCNVQEAQLILETEESDVKKLMQMVHELGPKIVCITDGPDGAYAFDSESGKMWHMPIYPDPAPPVDRTGAGDAFSSTFAIALAKGKSMEDALRWGPINSMSVVQKVGAQAGLLTEAQIEDYLANAPADYTPKEI